MIDDIGSEVGALAKHLRTLMSQSSVDEELYYPNKHTLSPDFHLFLPVEIHESPRCSDAPPNRSFCSPASIQHALCLDAEAVCFGLD